MPSSATQKGKPMAATIHQPPVSPPATRKPPRRHWSFRDLTDEQFEAVVAAHESTTAILAGSTPEQRAWLTEMAWSWLSP